MNLLSTSLFKILLAILIFCFTATHSPAQERVVPDEAKAAWKAYLAPDKLLSSGSYKLTGNCEIKVIQQSRSAHFAFESIFQNELILERSTNKMRKGTTKTIRLQNEWYSATVEPKDGRFQLTDVSKNKELKRSTLIKGIIDSSMILLIGCDLSVEQLLAEDVCKWQLSEGDNYYEITFDREPHDPNDKNKVGSGQLRFAKNWRSQVAAYSIRNKLSRWQVQMCAYDQLQKEHYF